MRTRFWENEYQYISSSTQKLANKIDQKKQTNKNRCSATTFLVSLEGDNGRCHFNWCRCWFRHLSYVFLSWNLCFADSHASKAWLQLMSILCLPLGRELPERVCWWHFQIQDVSLAKIMVRSRKRQLNVNSQRRIFSFIKQKQYCNKFNKFFLCGLLKWSTLKKS